MTWLFDNPIKKATLVNKCAKKDAKSPTYARAELATTRKFVCIRSLRRCKSPDFCTRKKNFHSARKIHPVATSDFATRT